LAGGLGLVAGRLLPSAVSFVLLTVFFALPAFVGGEACCVALPARRAADRRALARCGRVRGRLARTPAPFSALSCPLLSAGPLTGDIIA
jgi:hypothetical protein